MYFRENLKYLNIEYPHYTAYPLYLDCFVAALLAMTEDGHGTAVPLHLRSLLPAGQVFLLFGGERIDINIHGV